VAYKKGENLPVKLYMNMILALWYTNLTQGKVWDYQLSGNSVHCPYLETERVRET